MLINYKQESLPFLSSLIHVRRTLLFSFIFVVLFLLFIKNASATDEKVTPSDNFLQISRIIQGLEAIRFEMGKPKYIHLELEVRNATPRDVYFQLLTLNFELDRLAFEIAHVRGETIFPIKEGFSLLENSKLLGASLRTIELIKKTLKIKKSEEIFGIIEGKTSTNVYQQHVQANRQLDLMLEKRFSPADVYQQVSRILAYTASLQGNFPVTRVPKDIPLVKGKTPRDVFKLLMLCSKELGEIMALNKLEVLKSRWEDILNTDIAPHLVYTIANELLSEVTLLHSRAPNNSYLYTSYMPGRTFPSHVFQRASQLYAMLQELKVNIENNPQWLKENEYR